MLKNLILTNYQIAVFKHYMGITEYDIRYCLHKKSNKVRNPLRLDKHPSLGFMLYQNADGYKVLHCRDFGETIYNGDCFKIAGRVLKLNSDKGSDFIKILDHILHYVILKTNPNIILNTLPEVSKTEVRRRDYKLNSMFSFFYLGHSRNFLTYWKRLLYFDVETMLEENNIYDPLTVYVDGLLIHTQTDNIYNLGILYHLGIYKNDVVCKLYKPYTKYPNDKFKTNNKFIIEAMSELQGNKNLILAKSRKDCVILRSILRLKGINSIDVTSVNTESIIFNDGFSLEYIMEKYDNIYSIFDYDSIGISYMFYNYIVNGIIPIVITSEKEVDLDRCKFILEKIYYDTGIQYTLEEMFTILEDYSYPVKLPDYKGKDIADAVIINKSYSLDFILQILNKITNEESSVE